MTRKAKRANAEEMTGDKEEDGDLEVRPGGMLVQRRDADGDGEDRHAGPTITVKIDGSHDVHVNPHSTFGDLKKVVEGMVGVGADRLKVLFRGQEREDEESLEDAGVRDGSKVVVLEDASGSKRVEKAVHEVGESEGSGNVEEGLSEEMAKALLAIDQVRVEVDKLGDRVSALEAVVNSGTKVSENEFVVAAELLMRQLLKLDGIEAEGEARLQRKAEVRRIQKFHETLDTLKARNASPVTDNSNTASVTTEWETFDSGVGSLTPPPPPVSSTTITDDWERFD